MTSDKKRMVYLAEETANITRLTLFPQYLTLLFEIDGLVLNDDRNLNNIAVIAKDGRFDYCPSSIRGPDCFPTPCTTPLILSPGH